MEEEIKITASIDPGNFRCKLKVDRPLYPENSINFSSKEKARGVPLAEKIFQIGDVSAVRLSGNEVAITMTQPVDWKVTAKQIAELVRAEIRAGQPVIPPSFKFTVKPDDEIRALVQEIFDNQINPALASHGGSVDLIDVKDNKIYLRMSGGCQGCGSADATLKQGIEASIREKIPDITDILDVTDHAGGTNPYYS